MKFIIFNIVVAAALIYLVSNKDSGFDVSLPKFGDLTAAAAQALDRAPSPFEKFQNTVEAPTIADADLVASKPPPAKIAAVAPTPVAERPVTQVPVPEALQPAESAAELAVEPAVARRRAEVLGERSTTPPEPVRLATDRRQQLLDLAEEMEYLSAEYSVQ